MEATNAVENNENIGLDLGVGPLNASVWTGGRLPPHAIVDPDGGAHLAEVPHHLHEPHDALGRDVRLVPRERCTNGHSNSMGPVLPWLTAAKNSEL